MNDRPSDGGTVRVGRGQSLHAAIAARDGGWVCFYCDIPLAHEDVGRVERVQEESWDHCGCGGRHDLVNEPCPATIFYTILPGFGSPEADHVIPRSAGGSDAISNRVLACGRCNNRKSDRPAVLLLLELAAA